MSDFQQKIGQLLQLVISQLTAIANRNDMKNILGLKNPKLTTHISLDDTPKLHSFQDLQPVTVIFGHTNITYPANPSIPEIMSVNTTNSEDTVQRSLCPREGMDIYLIFVIAFRIFLLL